MAAEAVGIHVEQRMAAFVCPKKKVAGAPLPKRGTLASSPVFAAATRSCKKEVGLVDNFTLLPVQSI